MRGNTLINLRLSLKAECGYNMDAGVALGEDKRLNYKLANMQQFLRTQFEWPFLETREDIAIVGGQRFYNNPQIVSFDFPTEVEALWVNIWHSVEEGIKGEQYNQVNPDLNETLDPIARWQMYSPTQFEVWPPPTSGQTLRFWGTSVLPPLVADTNIALLDDLLVVLFTGAELLAKSKQADAQALLARANAHFNRLKGPNRPDMCFTLGGLCDATYRRPQRVVGIVGNTNH